MSYVIADPCISVCDGACVEQCPVDCIERATDQYVIDRSTCIDCGMCAPVCPVEAIFAEGDLPARFAPAIEKNTRFFVKPGS